jgi:predicted nucleotidyltransferase
MDLTFPARAIAPTLDVPVLLVLAGTTLPLTGNQISRLVTSGSKAGVFLVLKRLEQHGIIDVLEAGNSNLYSLNRDHVVAPAVLALIDLRGKLFDRISAAMREWVIPPVSAAVFGSAARGDGNLESDIDIFVVRPDHISDENNEWSNQIAELGTQVRRWSGNPASLIQATPSQVTSMISREELIVESLRNDAISLIGNHVLSVADVAP